MPAAKLDKILGIASVVAVFCLIFASAHQAIFDPDIWLHLKTGEYIVQNRTVPSKDIFSFALKGKPWVDHEWLFQAVSFLAYNNWQAEGLILLESYILILCFFVLFLIGYASTKSYLETAVLVFIASCASLIRFNIRPDIFSMLFLALYLYLLRFHIDKKKIWLLVPVQALWVNLHGYFFLGPLVAFFFIFPVRWKEPRLRLLFFSLVLACLLNPRGLEGALYPFGILSEIFSGKAQIFFKHIQELQPTLRFDVRSRDFYYLIVISCFLLMAANLKRLRLTEILLAIFFFLLSLTVRNVAFFSFAALLIIASYIGPKVKEISANIQSQAPARKCAYFFSRAVLAACLIAWIAIRIDKISRNGYYDFKNNKFISLVYGFDERHFPKAAVDFVLTKGINTAAFNDFNSGAYLVGRAFPARKVFIDGRTELYGDEFFKAYLAMMNADAQAFEEITAKYDIGALLISITAVYPPKIINYAYKHPQWKMVFFDEQGVVFLKDTPANKGLISLNSVDFNKYQPPSCDLRILGLRRDYPWPYVKRASLFNLLEEDELTIQEARQALRIMPNCAQAFHLLGKAYLRKGLYQLSLENLRSTLLFAPRNTEALLDLGACLKELKDYKSAIRALEGAIKFNKRYAPAYYELGCVYLADNDKGRAKEALLRALRFAGGSRELDFKIRAKLEEAKK